MDGVPTRSVGTGFCLSVRSFSASGRPADAQKRVPTEKTYPCETPTPSQGVGFWPDRISKESVGATTGGCPEQRFRHQDALGQARGPAPTKKTYP